MVDYQKVYDKLMEIPSGRVTTYGKLSKSLKIGPRVIGMILGKNSHPIIVPCHRVVCFDGELGGYNRGVEKKKKILEKEGLKVLNNKICDFNQVMFRL